MLANGQTNSRRALAVLASVIALPLGSASAASVIESAADPAAAVAPAATTAPPLELPLPDAGCLATTICTLKDRVRWRTPAWSPDFCKKVAKAVLTSSKRHKVPPALLLAVMVNESDLDEKAVNLTTKNGAIYAKDSGLMGIRCVVDQHGRCRNGNVRGLAWKNVMDPFTNIELGARELAHWRKGGGVTKKMVRVRDKQGRIQTKQKYVRCEHKTHAYWAHYNHGPLYIDKGFARHYPHRVAVLYHALAKTLNVDAPELRQGRITIHDPGKRPRTADRPIEPRYQKLCQQIQDAGGRCAGVATATVRSSGVN